MSEREMKEKEFIHTHVETAKLIRIPEHLGLLIIDGCLKTGEVYIDDEMVEIIETLWNKYKIGTVGCCKGDKDSKTIKDNIPWIQIGSGWNEREYPKWMIEVLIRETMEAIDKEAKFPILLYDPRCVPCYTPKGYLIERHYEELVRTGYEIDIPVEVIKI